MQAPFFTFREFYIPDYMGYGIRDYLERGILPGSFLTAVFSNNLVEAASCADEINLRNLPAYAAYLQSKMPIGSWGSTEKVYGWADRKKLENNK